MRYPIAIEAGDDRNAFGVVVPDLPGCFSAGDTLDDALTNASEAITLWIETVLDDGGTVPPPGRIETHRTNTDFNGWIWALAEIDPAVLSEKPHWLSLAKHQPAE
ncbi:type II toxin-antitoxin system HicB family antitoxin [uncultured Lamprocystis sp.]|jgi:predicted RNase H-like HicB family nuclease|uniref:type II toxin-antitoxin system HicB family antitoxin n=1 Tax=uncultured Lamprocystis sp. TaxID=543132 RepID=UPI0025F6EEAE|nr:type II toxin-antitoxin system HicB family antitoxin [uncultured Lamprocystis sp.]